ncbi:MAG: TIGR02594 family protein [Acetobacteraceae bacterium]
MDGVVGPQTAQALFGAQAPAPAAAVAPGAGAGSPVVVWFEEAKRLVGVEEDLGAGSNVEILDWARGLHIPYSGDDVPWCGLFVAHCIGSTLPGEPLPKHPLGARQWEHFGEETTPRLGAVMVFWRDTLASGLGHVGFYNGERDDAYQILGGNQGDKVSLVWVGKNRFRSARWPVTAASISTGAVERASDGSLSTKEA